MRRGGDLRRAHRVGTFRIQRQEFFCGQHKVSMPRVTGHILIAIKRLHGRVIPSDVHIVKHAIFNLHRVPGMDSGFRCGILRINAAFPQQIGVSERITLAHRRFVYDQTISVPGIRVVFGIRIVFGILKRSMAILRMQGNIIVQRKRDLHGCHLLLRICGERIV